MLKEHSINIGVTKMRKLMNGVIIGFGSALSTVVSAAWVLLSLVLESKYLVVEEAKVIGAAQIATVVGSILGIVLVVAGLGLELRANKLFCKTKTQKNLLKMGRFYHLLLTIKKEWLVVSVVLLSASLHF